MSLIGLLSPPEVHRDSAFAVYQRRTATSLGSLGRQCSSGGAGANVHRNMHRYLRSISGASIGGLHGNDNKRGNAGGGESIEQRVPHSSRFRHIMRERLRRERLSEGYADLHALLPPGRASKGAKNFVIGAAVNYIRELEGRKGWLSARNEELDRAAAAAPARSGAACDAHMVVKVRAESGYRSTVDVFEVVLRRLKAMEELRVTAIRSRFCAGVMCRDVRVESKISSCEADKAITNALMELEEIKSGLQDPTKTKSSFSCQVASGALMS